MIRTIGEDKGEQKVIDDIAAYGWHCMNIMADGDQPPFSFTIGLFQSYGHPELIIFGLRSEIAHQILAIAADAAKAGTPFDLSKSSDEFVEGYSCCFAQVPFSQYYEHVGYARWYYNGNSFPLYQIVWPSRDGIYPWHPAADQEFRAIQPILGANQSGT